MKKSQDRIVLLQKQLSIATKTLKAIDLHGDLGAWSRASEALKEIKQIEYTKGNGKEN